MDAWVGGEQGGDEWSLVVLVLGLAFLPSIMCADDNKCDSSTSEMGLSLDCSLSLQHYQYHS